MPPGSGAGGDSGQDACPMADADSRPVPGREQDAERGDERGDERCDWCGSSDTWWRNCKLLCRSCGAIVKSCADL